MMSIRWRLACLGLGALVMSMSRATADDDTVRLGGTGTIKDAGAELSRLDRKSQDQEEDDTILARYRGGYGRGYSGFGGGFYRGGYGYYGGYRGYYPRYNFGFSYYPRYYGGYYPRYYGGYGLGFGYTNYYYTAPAYYYSYPAYYGGFGSNLCIGSTIQLNQSPVLTLQLRPPVPPMNPNAGQPPFIAPQQMPNDGFLYDGGPANPVPLPQGTPEIKQQSKPIIGVPDRSVSLPLKETPTSKKYQYSAYGDKQPKAEPTTPKVNELLFVKGTKD